MKLRQLGAVSLLVAVGVAEAGPFNIRGGTFANDGTSMHGLAFTSGGFARSSAGMFFGNGVVAPQDHGVWREILSETDFLESTTWLGVYPGERPSKWSEISETPGGYSIGFGGLAKWKSNDRLYDFAWARLDLLAVRSAPADIIGPGEYVWFGQIVATDPTASPWGDVTILFDGKFERAVLNGAPAIDPNGQPIFLISVESSPGVHQLYLTDVVAWQVRGVPAGRIVIEGGATGSLTKAEQKRLKKELKQQRKAERQAMKQARKDAKRRAMLSGLPMDAFL